MINQTPYKCPSVPVKNITVMYLKFELTLNANLLIETYHSGYFLITKTSIVLLYSSSNWVISKGFKRMHTHCRYIHNCRNNYENEFATLRNIFQSTNCETSVCVLDSSTLPVYKRCYDTNYPFQNKVAADSWSKKCSFWPKP